MTPHHELITDWKFRKAVDMIDLGEIENLENYLLQNPEVVHQCVFFDEIGYFSNPGLLEFTAENPVRHVTPLDWAVYGKFTEIENYLRSVEIFDVINRV